MQKKDSFDIDKWLKLEASSLEMEEETTRILSHSSYINPIQILSLGSNAVALQLLMPTPRDINLAYRKKSLLVHPDKNPSIEAQDAFRLLEEAKNLLSDPDFVRDFLSELRDARNHYIQSRIKSQLKFVKLVEDAYSADELIKFSQENTIQMTPEVAKVVENDISNEVFGVIAKGREEATARASLAVKNEVGRVQKEFDVNAYVRKKRMHEEKVWDDSRDSRVESWKSFGKAQASKEEKKKKKAKLNVLG